MRSWWAAAWPGWSRPSELLDAGRRVILVDQEPAQNLGGAGLLVLRRAVLRRLARAAPHAHQGLASNWPGRTGRARAGFDRLDDEDVWPRRWAEAYVHFAAGEKRSWLHQRGVRWFPIVGWAERGGYTATGHGNSVPRFHITWGTGPGLVAPFAARAQGRPPSAVSCASPSGTGSTS